MTLEQLRNFCAIVETGSFRAAAEQLFKVQSAVSTAIHNLEQELGLSLFDRSAYRPKLTAAGQELYQRARELLNQSEELQNLASAFAQGAESSLTLAIDAMCPLVPLTPALKSFTQDFPETALRLQSDYLGGSLERLFQHKADLAIAEVWGTAIKELDAVRLFEVCFQPVISPQHPLAGQLVQAKNLRHQVQIIVASTRHGGHPDTTVLDSARHWFVSDAASKRDLLIQGLGWGFMPLHLVQADLDAKRLMPLDLDDQLVKSLIPPHARLNQGQAKAEMWLLRRQQPKYGPRAQWLWQALSQLGQISNQGSSMRGLV